MEEVSHMSTPPTDTRKGTITLESRRFLTEDTFEVSFRCPPEFQFVPGQRIRLHQGQLSREYSIISAPGDPHIRLCIRMIKGGRFSVLLAAVQPGARFLYSGPTGHFVFQPSPRSPVLVATGTGIAPYLSMVSTGLKDFTLLHGIRDELETYYRDRFEPAARLYVPCISGKGPEEPASLEVFPGRVTDYLEQRLPLGAYDFYLCGRREMVQDAVRLVDARFSDSRVFMEIFY
jgi:ferredoxin-NADP reductase